ncbi:MAG TPA: acyl-CoA synthetase, partial [Gaiellaceae bacterium]|nr:acyl-CoA synthetase [Gaiellaceae bacterium]
MLGVRIGRKRGRAESSSPLERALAPALAEGRWQVPGRFNFARDVVEALAADPKRPALTFLGPDGVIEPRTFLQLAEGATRWATVLREQGVRPGERVLVHARTGPLWLEALLGCLKAGAVAVAGRMPVRGDEVEDLLAVTGAAVVLADPAGEPELQRVSGPAHVHYLEEAPRRRGGGAQELAPTEDTAAKDVAYLVATVGTGGAPKLVAHTHGSTFAARVAAEHWLDLGPGDAVWCTFPGSTPQALWHVFGAWARGAQVVLHDGDFDPEERLELVFRLGATVLCQSPAEYRALAGRRDLARYRPPHLRRLVATGDALDGDVVRVFEQAWGLTVHDGYGQAETGIVVAAGSDAGYRAGSLGLPLPGHELAVVDDQGNELPTGIEGNLAVRGRPPTLFVGYWEAPEETRSAFRGDWYLTGDVATADEDGFFWFVARADDVIASGGRTFGPLEAERVLRSHEAVAECAVVGVRDLQRGGHFVRAFVVVAPHLEASQQLEAELRHFAAESLPAHQVPREIEFVDELPATGAHGKLRRAALRERAVVGRPLWDLPPVSEPAAEAAPQPIALVQPPAPAP